MIKEPKQGKLIFRLSELKGESLFQVRADSQRTSSTVLKVIAAWIYATHLMFSDIVHLTGTYIEARRVIVENLC